MTEEEIKKQQEKALRRAELDSVQPISFADLKSSIERWMLVPDKGIIKLLVAHYITNKFNRKAVWLMLIAPSGGGKTELLNGLLEMPDIYEVDTLTPNTFLSGMPGRGDASLLPKVNGKILVFKDWTVILSMQRDAKAEVLSQLRTIWDGHMRKPFGNGKVGEWSGKVSILAASTESVDMSNQLYAPMGERFLSYRIKMPNRKDVAHRSLNNDSDQKQMGWEIQKAFFAFFKGIDLKLERKFEKLDDGIKNTLVNIADFATMARSGVIRDTGMKKEVMFVPSPEMPTRLVQQLNSLVAAFIIINEGKLLPEDMDIIYKIALDSIPQTNRIVITEMAKANEQKTAEIAVSLGYPTEPIKMYLENLALLGVCDRIKGIDSAAGGTADRWTMKADFVDIMRKHEGVEEHPASILLNRASEDLNEEETNDEFDNFPTHAKSIS